MLRKVGTLLAFGALLIGSYVYAQSGNSGTTHVVLLNDKDFTVANGKFLSGVYECSDGGYIDISCLLGQFPVMNCPAGQAIQSIDSSLNASCIDVGSGSGPAGADTYVQYNNMGVFGADPNFTWNYTSSILTLGGGGPGAATFSGDVLANLGTPSNGTIEYCTNCTINTNPCTTGGTGAMAERINGAWVCPGAGAGTLSGTNNTIAKFTSSSTIGDSGVTDNGTTVTIATEAFSYGGALNITGIRAISTSVSANAGDRLVSCTSGSVSDKTYTLPNATGSGRTLDVGKVDSGTNSCKITVGAGAINSGTTVTLPNQWQYETCIDIGSSQWACRGPGTVS